jgi:ABC-type transporter Mla maintaining outer membrane lipid asymmetry ATPase subunit MlaF
MHPPIIALETESLEIARPSSTEGVVLQAMDWKVASGELWVVAGVQGAGKTALLETLAGLIPAAAGQVSLFGRPVGRADDDDAGVWETRRRMGFVFDGSGRLFSALTVGENILLPWCYHQNCSPAEALAELEPLIRHLQLESLLPRSPGSLGRSWSRRVALARCLVLKPGLLLLDNPLAGLDAVHLRWWRGFLKEAIAGHPMLGGEPLAVIATADAVRPYSGLDPRFALVAGGQWRILPDMEAVLASTGEDGFRNPTDIRP